MSSIVTDLGKHGGSDSRQYVLDAFGVKIRWRSLEVLKALKVQRDKGRIAPGILA